MLGDLLAPADGAEDSASTQGEESLPANFGLSDSEVRLAVMQHVSCFSKVTCCKETNTRGERCGIFVLNSPSNFRPEG